MAKVTDPLTLDEIRQLEVLLEMELNKILPNIDDDEKSFNKSLEIGMIKAKLMTMKRDLL